MFTLTAKSAINSLILIRLVHSKYVEEFFFVFFVFFCTFFYESYFVMWSKVDFF